MKMTINMNDIVEVQFTEYGKTQYTEFLKKKESIYYIPPMICNSSFYIWELFAIFGNDCLMRKGYDLFVNNEITLL